MFARINGRNELIVTLETVAKAVQKQSDRQWKISIGVMSTSLFVAIASIITAIRR